MVMRERLERRKEGIPNQYSPLRYNVTHLNETDTSNVLLLTDAVRTHTRAVRRKNLRAKRTFPLCL